MFYQFRYSGVIAFFRIPLGPDIVVNDVKASFFQFSLENFDGFTAPAIAAEGSGSLILKLQLFQEFQPAGNTGKDAAADGRRTDGNGPWI